MSSLNLVQIIGNLGADPETRYAGNGNAITNIRVAATETWKDKETGEKKQQTEWVRCTFFNKLAEVAGEYLKKGMQVYVQGKLRTSEYTDKEGVKKYSTDIVCHELKMLGKKEGGSGEQSERQASRTSRPAQSAPTDMVDDDGIPF